jgi:hypothetical protein
MATRSRIGIEMQDGSVQSIYCHWDGYPQGVGAMLQEHYQDPSKVEALIALGDISFLREEPAPVSDEARATHSFSMPAEGVTVAYHRDRGEPFRAPRVDADIDTFSRSDIEQYGYVFTQQGVWKIFR